MLAATYREFGNIAADGWSDAIVHYSGLAVRRHRPRCCDRRAWPRSAAMPWRYGVQRQPELRRSRPAAAQSDGGGEVERPWAARARQQHSSSAAAKNERHSTVRNEGKGGGQTIICIYLLCLPLAMHKATSHKSTGPTMLSQQELFELAP